MKTALQMGHRGREISRSSAEIQDGFVQVISNKDGSPYAVTQAFSLTRTAVLVACRGQRRLQARATNQAASLSYSLREASA